jgi:hypothetical protein
MTRITQRLLTHGQHPAPFAKPTLRRQNPRQEPSALARTLGSAQGAVDNGGPYRDCGGGGDWLLAGESVLLPAL